MRLSAALVGDLKKIMEQEITDAETAIGTGITQATDGLKLELRGLVTGAGLGDRLSKTWRGNVYPKGGKSMEAAGFVYNNAPHIVGSFATGVTIRPKHSRYLAIPTQYVTRREGRKVRPADFEEAGIPLRYVPPQGGRRFGLLVVDNFRVTSKGRARVASNRAIKTGAGVTTVVMFILVPQTTLKKRFDVDSVSQKWLDKVPRLVLAGWPNQSNKSA